MNEKQSNCISDEDDPLKCTHINLVVYLYFYIWIYLVFCVSGKICFSGEHHSQKIKQTFMGVLEEEHKI